MTINFNVSPYYDDYSEEDKFLRVLFRPGYPVQARELTQLQTILQKQVSRFGDHVFKQGAMVLPGQISYDDTYTYATLQATYNGVSVDNYIEEVVGYTIVGNTSGVRAKVVYAAPSTATDSPTLYFKYTQSGDSGANKTFIDNEILTTVDAPTARAFSTSLSSSIGTGSAASIESGVYYINGFFLLVESQTVILDKYTNSPSYRVGLLVTESIVTPEEEPALQDNAQGSSNFAAPGAHRYRTTLTLTKRTIETSEDIDFVELLRVVNGQIQYKVRTTDYSVLEQTLARRTFDESGNYVVRNFPIDIREHRDNNRGEWAENTSYLVGDVVFYELSGTTRYYIATTSGSSGAQPPIHTTGTATDGVGGVTWKYSTALIFNRGIYDAATEGGDDTKLAVGLEPGKAYVQGYELEKIGTEYVTIDKARDFNRVADAQTQTTVGNYVLVTNISNIPRVDLFQQINLYSQLTASQGTAAGTLLGTARARGIELHSLGATRDVDVYKLLLSDVNINSGVDFDRQVKQFYYNAGSSATNFTADIAVSAGAGTLYSIVGSATASSSTTITGTGTRFTSDLIIGDYVSLGGTIRRVTGITDDNTITVDASTTVSGVAISVYYTQVIEPENSSLIFPLPFYAVRKLRSNDDTTIGTSYTVTQRFVQSSTTASGGVCTLTINAIGSADTFGSSAENDNYLLIDNTSGDVIIPNSINVVSPSLRQVIFTLDGAYASTQFIILAAVRKTSIDAKEKTKTLSSTVTTITGQSAATKNIIQLGKADGYAITSIMMDTGTFASPTGIYTVNIMDNYFFDDGQRDSYYGVCSIQLRPGFPAPRAPIQVTFEYFEHGTGDYFSVDSYTGSGVRYEDIPTFQGISLRDFLDFRPRIDDTDTDFSSAGSSVTQIPKRGINVELDLSYYLARKDKIAIDFNGNFFQVKGVSSVNPAEPEDPKNGMVLYKLSLSPYTFGTGSNDIEIQSIDNRRYTMRDIGALEKRIDNLEYYTSLSMLEQETSGLTIPDENGLDRFKNGFIVDNFTGHGIGDVMSPDYNCSVDMENKELRPFFRMDSVNMIEKNSTNSQRTASNYQITGDIVTLPYTNQEFIKQAVASRVENINPFAIFTFIGKISLNPASDEWFEVDRRPDVVNNVEGNFNAIKTALEKSGALGTVWNSWQNQWSGAPRVTGTTIYNSRFGNAGAAGRDGVGNINLSPAELNARFGNKSGAGWAFRRVNTQIVATDTTQSRTGLKTVVVPKIDRQLVEDRVLSTAVIPYIRSRAVLIQGKGFKPESRLYAFFDSINVNTYIQPATKIAYTAVSGFGSEFNIKDNVGSNSTETARRIAGDNTKDTIPALNRGDVITGQTSGATAVCVGTELSAAGDYAMYVLNIKGTFVSGETIVGSISGARGTVDAAPTILAQGSALTSNFAGDMFALLTIPNTDSLRFRTGIKEVIITDSASNGADFTSKGSVQYRAQGILETKQATINAVRNATVATEVVNATRTITSTVERVVGDTGWYDPLAQTFLVQQKGGAFLTGVDIFFATKDDAIPVTLEIREVVNGYPGKKVLPFSIVTLNPDKVNLSSNSVTVEGSSYRAPDTATRFTFESPVFVNDATEYCIVLSSDSNNYRAWISQLGDKVAGTDRFISEQPYAGVFFKSQNASTWTADQTQDLMFTIYRAKFNTEVEGRVSFVNDVLPNNVLQNDPLQTTNGSNKVRIWHPDHDMFPSSKVRLQNIETGTYNGVPSTELNGTHTISDIDIDSYVITVTTNATASGFVGGEGVESSDNVQFDVLQPMVQNQSFSETNLEFTVQSTSGRSVDGAQVQYIRDTDGAFVTPNDSNYFENPRVIASSVNESNFLSGEKSLTLTGILTTTVDNLSPVIDMNRTSVVAIHNKITNSTELNTNVSPIDNRDVVSANTNIAFTATGMSTSDATTKLAFQTLAIGRYLTISGAAAGANNGSFLITNIAVDGSTVTLDNAFTVASAGDSITLVSKEKFFDEIAPTNGSQFSKYLTRRINLANPSSYLRIRMAVNVPTNAEIDVYYKLNNVGSNRDFATLPFTLIAPDNTIPKSNNYYNFTDIEFSEQDLTQFDAVQIKIVFRSTNSAEIPRIRDLRVIACA